MASPSLLDRARTRFTNALKDLGARRIAGHLQVDPAKAILIFGAPRGGSTWLEELVRTIPSTATIWEPLDLENNPPFARIGFWWRQHIPEGEQWPEAEALFQDLLAGRMLSNYLTRTSTLADLREADRLVVKFIRGNLLLPWMVQRFPLPKPGVADPPPVRGDQFAEEARHLGQIPGSDRTTTASVRRALSKLSALLQYSFDIRGTPGRLVGG
ncbi:MAG: hypothetical protein IPG69_07120 [Flavobacteriales bacterium]|nr:hypothetical protein [Flavobacteriales bacterium]